MLALSLTSQSLLTMLKNVPTGQFTEMKNFAFLDILEIRQNFISPQDLFFVIDPGLQRNSSSEKVRNLLTTS